ncbi:endolytic transglycosylase MltG [Variovorax sp. PvP013]|uniref:endolytic transglycosylase MltG n=1 Tax=Variovorax sp. PvP013 TaxID=3156435 RepID=UPI003D1BF895
MRRFLLTLFLFVAFVVLGGGALGLWWVNRPIALPASTVDLTVEPGTTPRGIAEAVAATGARVPAQLLYGWFRFSGQDRRMRAGSYELETGVTPRGLLDMLVRGEEATRSVALVEGWNFRQVRAALAKAEQLKPDTVGESDEALMTRLGRPGVHPEGRFFPDTYTYSKGSSDFAVLQRAMRAMDRKLEAAWAARGSDLPLRTADEALVLASIVEKETGQARDRAEISAVFNNRLRVGMPLQTDPTVIYGMGTAFSGNLRKKDLQTDTPWNTYTRGGLPPTPISMPGRAALLAAVQPAQSKSLYFVSRGDGSSHFSTSLDEHNRAVNRYQRGIEAPSPAASSAAPASGAALAPAGGVSGEAAATSPVPATPASAPASTPRTGP